MTTPETQETRTGRRERVRTITEQRRGDRGPLMPVLHELMEEFGCVTRPDLEVVADVLNLSVSEVHGVLSFYKDFRTTPAPAHTVALCRAEACQAVGAESLYAATQTAFADRDDIEVSEVFCLGNCALGPSGMLDGRLLGRLDSDRVRALSRGWQA